MDNESSIILPEKSINNRRQLLLTLYVVSSLAVVQIMNAITSRSPGMIIGAVISGAYLLQRTIKESRNA
jgi:hypothetical protein